MEKVIDELLSQPILPEAIFTVSDRLAMACLKILKKRNIRIPEDMALMGFSNLKVAELLSPSFTSVIQPALEMGQRAAELLLDLVEKKSKSPAYQTVTLPTELVIRDSTKTASE
jgi:LacI family transcriptional regulator